MIIIRWMTNDMFECVFVIEHTFIIVNIYLLCKTKILIILKRSTSNIDKEYTACPLLKTKPCVTTQHPFNVPSLFPHCPLTVPSMTLFPPLNKKSQNSIDNRFILCAINNMELIQMMQIQYELICPGITDYKLTIIDQLTTEFEFTIIVIIDIDTGIQYNMNQITASDVFRIFTIRTNTINILIKITISVSVLDVSAIVFDAKDQNFVKLTELECDWYVNSGNIAITINNLCKICIAAIMVGFFVFVILFAMQATNESIVSIEYDTISIVICAIQNRYRHKLYINSNISSKLNENRIIGYTTNKSITIVFMIVKYYTLATKTHKMDQLCLIVK